MQVKIYANFMPNEKRVVYTYPYPREEATNSKIVVVEIPEKLNPEEAEEAAIVLNPSDGYPDRIFTLEECLYNWGGKPIVFYHTAEGKMRRVNLPIVSE